MFLLFIFESISTTEVIIIGIIALVVFGPRKLPELGRKAGKLMAEFRSATNDFKSTWEREVAELKEDADVDKETRLLSFLDKPKPVENSIGRNGVEEHNEISPNGSQLELPAIKQVPYTQQIESPNARISNTESTIKETKKDWL